MLGASIAKYQLLRIRHFASGISRIGRNNMNPRDIILAAVRKNLPEPKVPLPALSGAKEEDSTTRTGYKQFLNIMTGGQKGPHSGDSRVPNFRREGEKR